MSPLRYLSVGYLPRTSLLISLLMIFFSVKVHAGTSVKIDLSGMDSVSYDFNASNYIGFSSSTSAGNISGKKYTIPKRCVDLSPIGKACTPKVNVDTRTGATFDASASFSAGYLAQGRFDLGFLKNVEVLRTGEFNIQGVSVGGARSEGFRSLNTGVFIDDYAINFNEWFETPKLSGTLSLDVDVSANVGAKAYLAGVELLDGSVDIGPINIEMDLFEFDTGLRSLDFPLPDMPDPPSLPELSVTEHDEGKIIQRTEVGPIGKKALIGTLFDPRHESNRENSVNFENGSLVIKNAVEILQIGVDPTKLTTAPLSGNSGIAGNFSVEYDLFSSEIGARLTYLNEIIFTPDVTQAQLEFDLSGGKSVTLMDSNGNVETLSGSNNTYAIDKLDELPDVVYRGDEGTSLESTLRIDGVALNQKDIHKLQITPTGSASLLPKVALKEGSKIKASLPKGTTKFFDVDVTSPIHLSTNEKVLVDNLLADNQSIWTNFGIQSYNPEFATYVGGANVPTRTVIDPLTGEARTVDSIIRSDKLSDPEFQWAFDKMIQMVRQRTAQGKSIDPVWLNERYIPNDLNISGAYRYEVKEQQVLDGKSYDYEQSPIFGYEQFVDQDRKKLFATSDDDVSNPSSSVFDHPARFLEIKNGLDLSLSEIDLGVAFNELKIAKGAMLHVRNLDSPNQTDRNLTRIENDGLLYVQAEEFGGFWVDDTRVISSIENTRNIRVGREDYERKLWFAPAASRVFTGSGTAFFETRAHIPSSENGEFIQTEDHTTIVSGVDPKSGENWLWFQSDDDANHDRFNNAGTFIAQDGARIAISLNGRVNQGVVNDGSMIAKGHNSNILFDTNQGVSNSGTISALNGGDIFFDERKDPSNGNKLSPINLFNTSDDAGVYLADGAGSLLEFRGRVHLANGDHNIQVKNGGRVEFDKGIGQQYEDEAVGEGRLLLNVGNDGTSYSGSMARFDGELNISQGGLAQFNGLSSRTKAGLDIINEGVLELLSGQNGTLVVNTGPRPSAPNVFPLPPPPPAVVLPLNLENRGKIIVREPAAFSFKAEIDEYSPSGVVLDMGQWDVEGIVRLKMDSIPFNEEITGLDASEGFNRTPHITHNRSDIRLAESGKWYVEYQLENGDTETRSLLSTLTVNEGRLQLEQDVSNNNDFVNDGRSSLIDSTLPGELIIANGKTFTVNSFVNRSGTVDLTDSGRLSATSNEYRFEGGDLLLGSAGQFDGIQRDFINSDHSSGLGLMDYGRITGTVEFAGVDKANADGTVSTDSARVQMLDRNGSALVVWDNYGDLTLRGEVEFEGLNYLGFNDANASITLADGAQLIAAYGDRRLNSDGFINDGKLIIGEGSMLDLVGDSVQHDQQAYFVQRGNGSFVIEKDATLIAETVKLTGVQKTIENDGRLLVNYLTLEDGYRLQGSGLISGDIVAEAGSVIGPGNSPGRMDLVGDITLGTGSLLEMEFDGYDQGEYDQLFITGTLDVFSDLLLDFSNFSMPIANSVFDIISVEMDEDELNVPMSDLLTGFFDNMLVEGLDDFLAADFHNIARYDALAVNGTFLGAYDSFDLFMFYRAGENSNLVTLSFLDGSQDFLYGYPVVSSAQVSLPSTIGLLGIGILGLVLGRRNREEVKLKR